MDSLLHWFPIEDAPKDVYWLLLGWEAAGPNDYIDNDIEPAFWHDGSQNYWEKEGWYSLEDRGNLLTAKPLTGATYFAIPTI